MHHSLEKKFQHLLHWVSRKTELIVKHAHTHTPKTCEAGEIYIAELGTNVGHEIDKKRPVLIFETSHPRLRGFDTVFVLPLTSNCSQQPFGILLDPHEVTYEREESSLIASQILIAQGRVISKVRLGQKIGVVSSSKLQEIHASLLQFLCIKNTPGMNPGSAQTSQ